MPGWNVIREIGFIDDQYSQFLTETELCHRTAYKWGVLREGDSGYLGGRSGRAHFLSCELSKEPNSRFQLVLFAQQR